MPTETTTWPTDPRAPAFGSGWPKVIAYQAAEEFTITVTDIATQPVVQGTRQYRVQITREDGAEVRDFLYPAYRVWTLLAHWTEALDDLRAGGVL